MPLRSHDAGSRGRSLAGTVKCFVDNLLPEGRALDITATTCRVSRSNIFALISALGAETTGAFRFWRSGEKPPAVVTTPPREVSREELDARLKERNAMPLAVWDGKVRRSIAGVQDKLMVYAEQPLAEGGRIYLVEPPLASTHILKPEPDRAATPHLVVNEHFCMSLARRMGLPAADVGIYRTPRPVLVVRRFDRAMLASGPGRLIGNSDAHGKNFSIGDGLWRCVLVRRGHRARTGGLGEALRHRPTPVEA